MKNDAYKCKGLFEMINFRSGGRWLWAFEAACLAALIVVIWSVWTGRTSVHAWSVPLLYGGDAYLGLANAKAYMDGDIYPLLTKWVSHLNAPFVANWNDWPITEDFLLALWGWLARFIGLFAAANFVVLGCHVLAGLSMWWVGRELGGKREYIWLCAIAYAMSPYAFSRGLPHLVLTAYWHLPVLVLISWWLLDEGLIRENKKKWRVSLFFSVVCGVLNPYYTWMVAQFFGAAFLKWCVRGNKAKALESVCLLGLLFAAFLVVNADTFYVSFFLGKNNLAVVRSLEAVELYGLKIPELLLPLSHSWKWLSDFSQSHYYSSTLLRGEIGPSYLGWLGVAGFLSLLGYGVFSVLRDKTQDLVAWWQVLWVLLYSLVGGVGLVFGSFGLLLFRAANRFSVVVLTLSLMFLIAALSKIPSKSLRFVAVLLIPVVLFDQLPGRVKRESIETSALAVAADRAFAQSLEKALPKGGMVFQLPVKLFPETPPIVNMGDYEHFRPYFYTSDLKYSYGTTKGRGDEAWQATIAGKKPAEMLAELERFGFSALYINKKGYEDGGRSLVSEVAATSRAVIAETPELIAFKLHPVGGNGQSVPAKPPSFKLTHGWSGPESGHRWAEKSKAVIDVGGSAGLQKPMTIRFTLTGLQSQNVSVFVGDVLGASGRVEAGGGREFVVEIPAGGKRDVVLTISSDVVPALPGNGDGRKLSFDIKNIVVDGEAINI